ncbi:aspartyl protease family protein [Phenylobacterium sp. SCN 70-31]|uniref:aspartyl protease family protein n=1 Tax=Phenylobacterium sp. SCN 70-31 TaxID=1660129 RepID=UPI000B09E31D|nr:aspartyl protease family protein [Phenylobacterium sp. SCN 70-31]
MARIRLPVRASAALCWAGLFAMSAGRAGAGEVACRFEAGVITVPAVVGGVAADYILDTGSPTTQLHETKARMEGIAEDRLTGDVRLAGMTVRGATLNVADLDVRNWNLPTPSGGVIGADVLRAFVVDVSYAPCRVRLWRPGEAPKFQGSVMPLSWDAGRPTAEAEVSDDVVAVRGRFVVATGANAPVRLADDLARTPGASRPDELYPQGVWLARLPQVRFAGAVGRDVAAGLMKPDGDVAGVLGGAVLAHFRLRFDFPAGRLIVRPAR